MDWRREPSDSADDPMGLTALLGRAQAEIGGEPIHGTRFVHTAEDMLRSTRAIEAAVSGVATSLFVGFQNAQRLVDEAEVYRSLTTEGVQIFAFGEGRPDQAVIPASLLWTQVPPHPYALENQWFLVTRSPEPIALVAFEASPEIPGGADSATDQTAIWEGFVSTDERIVNLVIEHLESVVRLHRDS